MVISRDEGADVRDDDIKPKNWAGTQRYAFIEFRLFWHGRINRSDLMDTFGISTQQAAIDLTGYAKAYPDNTFYSRQARGYIILDSFQPNFIEATSEDYLAQLLAVKQGLLRRDASWTNDYAIASITTPARGVVPETLRDVLAAIEAQTALGVIYQSMAYPEPQARWIEPHALAYDGFRWHTRAFCRKDTVFKDFLLSRILSVEGQEPRTADPVQDRDWHTEVILEIGPHPALSPGQKKAIGLDYNMQRGRGQIKTRRALMFYTLNRLGLDTDPDARRPQDQQIVLLNRDQVFCDREGL